MGYVYIDRERKAREGRETDRLTEKFGFGLVLGHINHCRLFNAKSGLFMYIRYIRFVNISKVGDRSRGWPECFLFNSYKCRIPLHCYRSLVHSGLSLSLSLSSYIYIYIYISGAETGLVLLVPGTTNNSVNVIQMD